MARRRVSSWIGPHLIGVTISQTLLAGETTFVAIALLLNPFVPIRMQRAQWRPIDLWLGIFSIGWSGYCLFRKRI